MALALAACPAKSSRSGVDGAPGDAEGIEIARARAIAEGETPLPERSPALALAASMQHRAAREGAGVRAVALHTTAARLFERIWRTEGQAADAREAIDEYRAASHDAAVPGACDAALGGARLAGDIARDASVTYAQLYRIERRFARTWQTESPPSPPSPPSVCQRAVDDALAVLVAFRPSPEILEAIDDSLASEGAILHALDSGTTPPIEPLQVSRVESWAGRDAARVVVVLNRPAPYRIGDEVPAGGGDPGAYLDLDGVQLGTTPSVTLSQGVITRIRAEATSTGSRFWLDLDGHAWRRVFELREPYRIIIDIARHPPGVQGNGPRTVSRVVLDPGHGGSDKGAHGPGGVEEKDVALDIAHRAAPALATQGIQVVLTRDDDRYISLEERTARANAFGADLFLSIHCNASEGRARRGIETYVLDTTRDEIATRVAARENETTQAASGELASILGGMRMADEARRSKRLAQLLLRASATAVQMKYGDAVDGGMHAAGFYVLVGARMPAVLFETSYISNAADEQRLGSSVYRQLLADAIVNAVRAYREGR